MIIFVKIGFAYDIAGPIHFSHDMGVSECFVDHREVPYADILFLKPDFLVEIDSCKPADTVSKGDPPAVRAEIAFTADQALLIILVGDRGIALARKDHQLMIFVKIAFLYLFPVLVEVSADSGVALLHFDGFIVFIIKRHIIDQSGFIGFTHHMRITGVTVDDQVIRFIQPGFFQFYGTIQVDAPHAAYAVRQRDPGSARSVIPFAVDQVLIVILIADAGIPRSRQEQWLPVPAKIAFLLDPVFVIIFPGDRCIALFYNDRFVILIEIRLACHAASVIKLTDKAGISQLFVHDGTLIGCEPRLFQNQIPAHVDVPVAADAVGKRRAKTVRTEITLSAYKAHLVIFVRDRRIAGSRQNRELSFLVEIALHDQLAVLIVIPGNDRVSVGYLLGIQLFIVEGNIVDAPRLIDIADNVSIARPFIDHGVVIIIQPHLLELEVLIKIDHAVAAGSVSEGDTVPVLAEIPFLAYQSH